MIKDKAKRGDQMYAISIAIPDKLNMEEAIEFLDREINIVRNKILEGIAKRRGVKIEYTN